MCKREKKIERDFGGKERKKGKEGKEGGGEYIYRLFLRWWLDGVEENYVCTSVLALLDPNYFYYLHSTKSSMWSERLNFIHNPALAPSFSVQRLFIIIIIIIPARASRLLSSQWLPAHLSGQPRRDFGGSAYSQTRLAPSSPSPLAVLLDKATDQRQ